MRSGRFALLPVLMFSLSVGGCVSGRLKRAAEENTLFSDEAGFLSQMARMHMQGSFGLSPAREPEAWAAVASVMRKLEAALKEKPAKSYRVFVVDADVANAFSLPSYEIYVTRGLLELIPSEDVLAFMLGHEIAHRELKHYAEVLERFPMGGMFTQGNELDADRFGRELAERAGYRAMGAAAFFEMLAALERRYEVKFGGFLSSHPALSVRLVEMEKGLESLEPRASGEAFRRMKDAFRARGEAYLPFSLGSLGTSEILREAIERVEKNLDVALAERALLALAGGGGREQELARSWLAKLYMRQGRTDEARKMLAAIDVGKPDWKLRVEWQEFEILAWEGEVRDAAELAFEKPRSPECVRKDLPLLEDLCLEFALELLLRLKDGFPEDGDERYARLGERYLQRRPDGSMRAHAISAVMAYNVTRDPRDRIVLSSAARQSAGLPARAGDWLALESDLDKAGRYLSYRERGLTFFFGAGYAGLPGLISDAITTPVPLALGVGWRFWPWEVGLDMMILSGGGGRHPVSGVGMDLVYGQAGLYLEREWSRYRLRPFTRFAVRYASLDGVEPKGTLTEAAQLGLTGGASYRLNSRRSQVDTYLRLSGEVDQGFFSPLGGVEVSGLGWQVRLDFLMLVSNGSEEVSRSDPESHVRRRPPHFF